MNAKILIIEDEFLIRNQLSQIDWSQTGAALSGAFPDTRSAWDFVKHNHPDILITDIQLGDENGLEFAQKLKSHLPKLKIIVPVYADRSIFFECFFNYDKFAVKNRTALIHRGNNIHKTFFFHNVSSQIFDFLNNYIT